MAVKRVYEADISFNINVDGIRSQLKSLEADIAETTSRITRNLGGFGDFEIGPQGGLKRTPLQDVRKLAAQIKEQLGGVGIESTQEFTRAFDQIALSVGTTSKQLVAALARVIPEVKPIWEQFRQTGVLEAEKLKDVLVGNSIIPDMVNDIIAWIRKLPPVFEQIGAEIQSTFNQKLLNLVAQVTDQFRHLENVFKAEDIAAQFLKASNAVERFLLTVNQGVTAATGFTNFVNPIGQVLLGVNALISAINVLVSRSKLLGDIADAFERIGRLDLSASTNISPEFANNLKAAEFSLRSIANEIEKTQHSPLWSADAAASVHSGLNDVANDLKRIFEASDASQLDEQFRKLTEDRASLQNFVEVLQKVTPILGLIDDGYKSLGRTSSGIDDVLGRVADNIIKNQSEITETFGSLSTRSESEIKRLGEGIKQLEPFNPIRENAKQVYNDVVGNSIIPDLVNEVAAEFRTLPDKTAPAVLALRDEFNRLAKQFRDNPLTITDPSTGRTVTDDLEDLKVAVQQVRIERLNELGDQFDRVREAGSLASTSLIDKIRDIGTGIQVGLGPGGNALIGLRTALAGIGPSSNPAIQALDKLGSLSISLGETWRAFVGGPAKQLEFSLGKTAQQTAEYAASLGSQVDILKDLHRAQGGQVRDLGGLETQVTRVVKSLKDIETTALAGGKINQQVQRAQTEAIEQLTFEYENLVRRGIIPAGSEADRAFQLMISDARSAETAVNLLTAQQNKLTATIERTGGEATGLAKVLGRLGDAVSSPFRLFQTGQTAVSNFGKSVVGLANPVNIATKAVGGFRETLFAVFGGNILTNLVQNLAFSLQSLPGTLIKLGADAEESMSAFQAVFQESAEATETSLTQFAEATGRSRFELVELASGIQSIFVPLGFARDQAAELSDAMVKLSVDVGSFRNASQTDVLQAFQSAIVGNHNAVDKYGIAITEASLSQELMNLGLADSVRTATELEKVQARVSLIMKGSADAFGDAARTSESWTNQSRALGGVLRDTGTEIGFILQTGLAPLLRVIVTIAREVGPELVQTFQNVTNAILPFATALADALSAGDAAGAVQLFVDAISNGFNAMVDYLGSFVDVAFDWGVSFVTQIYNGLIDAANTLLAEAAAYIGSIISSFLEPGSPPEEGPLADIDKWGKGLIDTFSTSFTSADFAFVKDALSPIKSYFQEAFGEQGFEPFKKVRGDLVLLTEEINRTGTINEGTFQNIAGAIGEGKGELVKFLRVQLELQKAQKNLADIQNEVTLAEKAGFVPKELRDKLKAAESQVEQAKENVEWQKQFLDFQSLSVDEFKKMDKAAKGIGSSVGGGVAAGAKIAKTALDKLQEFVKTGYAEEKRLLDEKLRLGAISQEEYYRELIKLEEKYIDASQRTGLLAGIEDHVTTLNNAKDELAAILDAKKVGKGAKVGEGGLGDVLAIDDILGGFDRFGTELEKGGQNLGGRLLDGFKTVFRDKSDELKDAIRTSFSDALAALGENLRERFGGAEGPLNSLGDAFKRLIDNIKAFVTAFGLLSAPFAVLAARSPAVLKSLGPLGKAMSFLGTAAGKAFPFISNIATKAMPAFQFVLTKILPNILKFGARIAGIGVAIAVVIEGIRSNRDQLVAIFNDFVTRAGDMARRFIKAIQPIIDTVLAVFGKGQPNSASTVISEAVRIIKGVVDSVLPSIQKTFEGVFNAIYGTIQTTLLPAIDVIIGVLALLTGQNDLATESFTKAWENVKEGLPRLFGGILQAGEGLLKLLPNVFGNLGANLLELIGFEETAAKIREITTAISDTIHEFFTGLADAIRSFIQGDINFGQFVDDLIASFSKLSENATKIGDLIKDEFTIAFEELKENLPIWIETVSTTINNVVQGVIDFLGETIGPLALSLRDKFVSWLDQAVGGTETEGESFAFRLGEAIGQFIGSALTFVTQTVPTWIAQLVGSIGNLINDALQFADDNWPGWRDRLFTAMSNLVTGAITFFSETLPAWIDDLVAGIGDLVLGFLTYAEENYPTWQERLQTVLGQIVDGAIIFFTQTLPTWIGQLATALGDFIAGAATGFEETAPEWTSRLGGILGAIVVNGIANAALSITQWVSDLKASFNDWFNQTFDKTDEEAPNLGYRIGYILGTMIRSGFEFWFVTIPEEVQKFYDGIQNIFTGGIGEWENGAPDLATRLGEGVGLVVGGVFVFFTQQLPTWISDLQLKTETLISAIPNWLTEHKGEIANNIWTGVQGAIQGMFDLFSGGLPGLIGKLGDLFKGLLQGAIDAAIAATPAPLRKLLGLDEAGDVANEAAATASQFDSAFANVGTSISTPVEQGTEDSVGFFQGMFDAIVGNSIVPDMVTQIGVWYQTMSTHFGTINQQMLQVQIVTSQAMIVLTQTTVEQMTLFWTLLLTNYQTLFAEFLLLFTEQWNLTMENARLKAEESFTAISLKVMELIQLLAGEEDSAVAAGIKLTETLTDVWADSETELDKLYNWIKDTLIPILEQARDTAAQAADNIGGLGDKTGANSNSGPNLTAGLGVSLRDNLAGSLSTTASFIGAASLLAGSLTTNQTQAAQSVGGLNQTIYMTNNFPNVTSADEARSIADILDDLIGRGQSFAAVG